MSEEDFRYYAPKPIEIIKALDEVIIGQSNAKKILAIAALRRYMRILQKYNRLPVSINPIEKANVLLVGSTGVGKTSIIKAFSDVIDVPITIADITGTTGSGYVGHKVEDIITRHIDNVSSRTYHRKHARVAIETGIIYIDEVDKTRTFKERHDKDVNGAEVQFGLLKLLEMNQSGAKTENFDLTDVLFILGGAFSGLTDIIKKRLTKHSSAGFTASILSQENTLIDGDYLFAHVTTEDLVQYGMIPELIGRIPLVATFHPLNTEMLKKILLEPRNSVINQMIEMFAVFGITLEFTDSAITEIAKRAQKLDTGARALKGIVANIMEPYQLNIFDFPTNENLVIDKKDIHE